MASGGESSTGTTTESQCGECLVGVKQNDKALQCDLCNTWVHIKCGRVSDSMYNSLKKASKDGTGVKWFCDKCEPQFEKIKSELRLVSERQAQMEEKQTELDLKVKKLTEEWGEVKNQCEEWKKEYSLRINDDPVREETVGGLKDEIESLKKSYADMVVATRSEGEGNERSANNNKIMQMEVSEAMEREKRRYNLVIFGLEETGDELATKRKVKEIENIVGIEEGKVKYFGRVGRLVSSGKARAVRIVCEDAEAKRSFLKGANKLKESEGYQRVYINQDLTKVQQGNDKKLRDKLKEIRQTHREAKISNTEIVIFENGNRKVLFSIQN